MSAPVLTSAEYLASIKLEAKIGDTSEDQTILDLTNEALIEAASLFPENRGLNVDELHDVSTAFGVIIASVASGSPIFLTNILQVYYQKFTVGVFTREWDLSEVGGIVYPSPIEGTPSAYTIKQQKIAIPFFQYILTFSPTNSGIAGDKIRIIGTGVRIFTAFDTNNQFDMVDLLPFVKRSVLHRLMIKKNQQMADQMSALVARTVPPITNNADTGDQINDTQKNA